MTQRKSIPIGIEFYKEMVQKDYYYVDKTMLIHDILKQKSKVILFTRPRRFGKTLSQSMLCTFFEKEILLDGTVTDPSVYFEGKKIMAAGDAYIKHMGQYPVIFLSLKSAKQPDFETAYAMLKKEIRQEFERHKYVLEGGMLSAAKRMQYQAVVEDRADQAVYAAALHFLSECLEQYHQKKTIILLDEYDVPLEAAYFNGFYDKMSGYIRSLFESALKTNKSLEFAVITGCLRISRESIFTGLNNLEAASMLDCNFAGCFGFVQQEVAEMLMHYGLSPRMDEIREWYDGYLFGNTEVYNPWSIVNYVKDLVYHNTDYPKPYWANTSSNNIVRELIERADDSAKRELEQLVAGGILEKPVYEDITYADLFRSQDSLWTFLYFTGYLKSVGRRFESDTIRLILKVPNKEILYIYNHTISEWFKEKIRREDFSELYSAVIKGRAQEFEHI